MSWPLPWLSTLEFESKHFLLWDSFSFFPCLCFSLTRITSASGSPPSIRLIHHSDSWLSSFNRHFATTLESVGLYSQGSPLDFASAPKPLNFTEAYLGVVWTEALTNGVTLALAGLLLLGNTVCLVTVLNLQHPQPPTLPQANQEEDSCFNGKLKVHGEISPTLCFSISNFPCIFRPLFFSLISEKSSVWFLKSLSPSPTFFKTVPLIAYVLNICSMHLSWLSFFPNMYKSLLSWKIKHKRNNNNSNQSFL